MSSRLACVLFEDDHLLVVNKPPGWNTHSPAPHAGEGIYDWLRHREPRWGDLAIIHRLDKETSGVLLFAKSALANRALTEQFARREVHKRYLLGTRGRVTFDHLEVRTALVRLGDKYAARPISAGCELAETRFEVIDSRAGLAQVRAIPITGRTHQIRVHAAANGFPILGDTLYGGPGADRLWLHAEELRCRHPASGEPMIFRAEADFAADPHRLLREAIIDRRETNAWRMVHGETEVPGRVPSRDDTPDFHVDCLGDWLLSEGSRLPGANQREHLRSEAQRLRLRGAYHRVLDRHLRRASGDRASPTLLFGDPAPERFAVLENGVRYELGFREGYSVGLFLDQRDNRRRLLLSHVAAGFPLFPGGAAGAEALNVFAYTCGFSVCAGLAGARTTSVDLSRKYLEWGRRNFALNGLDAGRHDFIVGDAFEWLRRLARKQRVFDVVLLDPPTFSTSKKGGRWSAERDFGRLVTAALPLVKAGGVLFVSTNAARLGAGEFVGEIHAAVRAGGREVRQQHYVPQPPDFPISREEPAYLKTLWLRLS